MMKFIFFDYVFSFMICCSSKKYIPTTSKTEPSFSPLEISYSTSPVLPISPGCLQGLSCISHTPWPNWMNYVFNRDQTMLSKSIVDSQKKLKAKWPSHLSNVEDWHAAFGVCGLGDRFLFCVRWSETALGLGFRGFVRLLKMFLFTFPAVAF